MVFLQFIQEHWVSWVFAVIITILSWSSKVLWGKFKEIRIENAGLKHGVRALLHNEIIKTGKELITKGYCTPEDYEDLNYLYISYHDDLGGNGSAERMMEQVRKLPQGEIQEDD